MYSIHIFTTPLMVESSHAQHYWATLCITTLLYTSSLTVARWNKNICLAVIKGKSYQSSPMGTLKGKVQRLATVGMDRSSTIQSMSFFRRIAMLLGNILNGCQSWMIVALGRTPCITSDVRYSRWIAVWSRRTGEVLVEDVDKVEYMSPSEPRSERRSLRSSALKRTRRIPCRKRNLNSGCTSRRSKVKAHNYVLTLYDLIVNQFLPLIPAW